ncbi:hypothetical protein [Labrys sp. ZIDIC5]|uniref:hypothetical protein n=1 Tax=Labrys sedimenti TaxID=3106036 RepID=UPI002ACA5BC6|nr:hypothetical protein [Labrys sp. ZIDIC5]MDZ5454500.1 hypothetical protein [Labrys sp. ZIDIC5]
MTDVLLTSNPGFSTSRSSFQRQDPAGLGFEIEADDEKARRISTDTGETCAPMMATNEEQAMADEAPTLLIRAEQAISSGFPTREPAIGPVAGTPTS